MAQPRIWLETCFFPKNFNLIKIDIVRLFWLEKMTILTRKTHLIMYSHSPELVINLIGSEIILKRQLSQSSWNKSSVMTQCLRVFAGADPARVHWVHVHPPCVWVYVHSTQCLKHPECLGNRIKGALTEYRVHPECKSTEPRVHSEF